MDLVNEIISTVTSWVTGFTTLVITTLEAFIPLFWDATPVTGGLTVFGILGLMSMAIGLVLMGLAFAKSFFLK